MSVAIYIPGLSSEEGVGKKRGTKAHCPGVLDIILHGQRRNMQPICFRVNCSGVPLEPELWKTSLLKPRFPDC